MSTFDYLPLDDGQASISFPHPKKAALALLTSVCALGGLLAHSKVSFFGEGDSERKPFVPREGIGSVVVPGGPPAVAMVAPPAGDQVSEQPGCLFLYGTHTRFAIDPMLRHCVTVSEGCLYGAQLGGATLATPTGVPEDVLRGQLLCYPRNLVAEKVERCDRLLGYSPIALNQSVQVRGAAAVVKRSGAVRQAFWYYKPIVKLVEREKSRLPAKYEFKGRTPEAILALSEQYTLDISQAVVAWYSIGSVVRRRGEPSMVAQIRNDPRCVALRDKVRQALPELGATKVSNVWLGVRDLQERDEQLLRELQDASLRTIKDIGSQGISNTLNALANCASPAWHADTALVEALCKEAMEPEKARTFSPQHISNLLNAVAKLGYHPPRPLLDAMCVRSQKVVDRFTPQQLSTALNAFGKLNFRPEDDLLRALCDQSLKVVHDFNSLEISNMLNALAKLNYKASSQLLHALCHETLAQISALQSKGVAIILNALARLEFDPGPGFMTTMCNEGLKRARAGRFNPQDISNFVNAAAKLNFDPGEEVLRVMCEEAVRQRRGFVAQGISILLNGLAKIGYTPSDDFLRIMSEEADRKHAEFRAQHISNFLNALGRMNYHPERSVIQTMAKEAVLKVHSFSSQGLANTINALARLNYYPGKEVLDVLCGEVERQWASFNMQEIAVTLGALGRLGHDPGKQCIQRMGDAAVGKSDEMSVQNGANVLHALCVLGYYLPNVFETLIQHLSNDYSIFGDEELSQLYAVHLTLVHEFHEHTLRLPAEISQRALKLHKELHDRAVSSELHLDVSKVLDEDLHIAHLNEDIRTGLSVDILVPEQKLIVEVDGPTHFSTDLEGKSHYLGTTLHKHRLLKAMGYHVLSVPFYEWGNMWEKQTHNRTEYLREKLRSVGINTRTLPAPKTGP
eukprot:g18572.t1